MLQEMRHLNVVLFFGAGTMPNGSPFLVTELVELGDLMSYLARCNPADRDWFTDWYVFCCQSAVCLCIYLSQEVLLAV